MFSEEVLLILRIRATLVDAARCWLNQNGYVEVHGPTLIPEIGCSPSHFEVSYFGKKACLSQGLQPYANYFVSGFSKVYTIAPTFRAEVRKTKRHLSEFWRIEVTQCSDLDAMLLAEEELVVQICRKLAKTTCEESRVAESVRENLACIDKPFPKITYDEAVNLLKTDGFDIQWGARIDWQMEHHLSLKFEKPFFIRDFPLSPQTIFYKAHPDRPELTLSADLIAPEGYGEISGCVQFVDDQREMMERMKQEKIGLRGRNWYGDFMRANVAPQSGFILGIERMLQWICRCEKITDVTAFPRGFGFIRL